MVNGSRTALNVLLFYENTALSLQFNYRKTCIEKQAFVQITILQTTIINLMSATEGPKDHK